MAESGKPLPISDEVSAPYWDAAREGRLLLQRCTACGRHQFYPRGHCAGCFADAPEWVEAAGTGRLHTFTVVHRTAAAGFRDEVPYAFAIVELDEGPRMTANVVDTPLDSLRCDMAVHVVFTPAGDAVLPNVTALEG
jgi:uncharacterized OB-fold protein